MKEDEATRVPDSPDDSQFEAPDAQITPDGVELDELKVQMIMDRFRAEQNLGAGLVAGVIAAAAGAGLWAAITVMTGYQIGWMAIGVGFLVGWAVRQFGRGVDVGFAVAGAVLALLGCVAGNLLAGCGLVAQETEVPFLEVLGSLDPTMAVELMTALFSPMDLLFYGFAIYEGFQLSRRQVTVEDLQEAVV